METNSKNTTEREYDRFYAEKDFSRFPVSERALVGHLVKRYQLQGKAVLDIGCGTGRYTELFRSEGMNAVGADLSSEAIRIARENYPQCTFITDSIENLELPSDSMDLAFCHGFSPFLQKDMREQHEMVSEIASFLKKDGIFFFGATSRLTDRRAPSGSRWDYSLSSYLQLFRKVPELEVREALTVFPQMFTLPAPLVFSEASSRMAALTARCLRMPLRVYIALVRK
jgi:SAM-dependent methyltransferase